MFNLISPQRSPENILRNSWGPCASWGATEEVGGMHLGSLRDPCGIFMESLRTPQGIIKGSLRHLGRNLKDSCKNPLGMFKEC